MLATRSTYASTPAACANSGTATTTATKPGTHERTREVVRVATFASGSVTRRRRERSASCTSCTAGTYHTTTATKGAWPARHRGTCAACSTSTHTTASTGNDIGGAPARITTTTAAASNGNPVSNAIAAYAKVCRSTTNAIRTLANAARVYGLRRLPTHPDGQGGAGSNGKSTSHTPAQPATAARRVRATANAARSAAA
ncbi:MAG: hypothetical protein RR779_07345 [Comamonas sp.]